MDKYDFSRINREVQRRMELGNTHHSLEGERMAEKMLLISGEELEQILRFGMIRDTPVDPDSDLAHEPRICDER